MLDFIDSDSDSGCDSDGSDGENNHSADKSQSRQQTCLFNEVSTHVIQHVLQHRKSKGGELAALYLQAPSVRPLPLQQPPQPSASVSTSCASNSTSVTAASTAASTAATTTNTTAAAAAAIRHQEHTQPLFFNNDCTCPAPLQPLLVQKLVHSIACSCPNSSAFFSPLW